MAIVAEIAVIRFVYFKVLLALSVLLLATACDDDGVCYSASDLGEGNNSTVSSTAGSASPGGCTPKADNNTCSFENLASPIPFTNQIAKWTPTGMYTNGISNVVDANGESASRGVLKVYITGAWQPWDNSGIENLPQCNIATLPATGPIYYDGRNIAYDPALEDVANTYFVSYGNNYSSHHCQINDATGLYGLIAIVQDDGTVTDPNSGNYNTSNTYPPSKFRVFHMKMDPENFDEDGRYFIMTGTENCGNAGEYNNCIPDISSTGNPFIQPGRLFFKIVDTYYLDNSGSLELNPVSGVYIPGGLISQIVNAFESTITTAQDKMLKSINSNSQLINIVHAMIIFYFVWTAIGFLIGTLKLSQSDVIARLFKVSIIFVLLSDQSYNFFNYYLYSFFTTGAQELAGIINTEIWSVGNSVVDAKSVISMLPANARTPFIAFDYFFRVFLKPQIHCKIAAILFTNNIYIVPLLYVAIFMIISMALKCLLMYILAITYTAILLAMAPFFISFILFEATKTFFESWLKQLMSNALMCIVATAAFAFIGSLLMNALDDIFHYRVCYTYLKLGSWTLRFDMSALGIPVFGIQFWQASNLAEALSATSLLNTVQLLLLVSICKAFVDQIAPMVDAISENQLSPLSSGVSQSWAAFGAKVATFKGATIGAFDAVTTRFIGGKMDQGKEFAKRGLQQGLDAADEKLAEKGGLFYSGLKLAAKGMKSATKSIRKASKAESGDDD